MEPNVTHGHTIKHHSKLTNNEQNCCPVYEAIEATYQTLEDPKQIVTPIYGNVIGENAVDFVPSSNKQLYEDPGHKKEVIYSWFEKNKFQKIRKGDIRYHLYTLQLIIAYMLDLLF